MFPQALPASHRRGLLKKCLRSGGRQRQWRLNHIQPHDTFHTSFGHLPAAPAPMMATDFMGEALIDIRCPGTGSNRHVLLENARVTLEGLQ